MKTVAVVGLSGVGKSTSIRRAAMDIDLLHLQASALIKLEQEHRAGSACSSEDLRLGPVLDNQALMLAAFSRMTHGVRSLVVFDGHTIIDGAAGPIFIPAEVFNALGCKSMAFLWDEPELIAQRRQADHRRDRPALTSHLLSRHQNLAERAAREICGELDIPLKLIKGSDQTAFQEFLVAAV
ncbi:AAA family ATPase [Erythrobacteraceae bacterium WH01K]|nr:AAA family ATPase [Erythrobacteraceae bacterium WH01K]